VHARQVLETCAQVYDDIKAAVDSSGMAPQEPEMPR
jgi:hypothetical protein